MRTRLLTALLAILSLGQWGWAGDLQCATYSSCSPASQGLTYTGNNTFSGSDRFTGTLAVPATTSLPATCTAGPPSADVYVDTDATSGSRWYVCESTNTWKAQGASSGGLVMGTSTDDCGTGGGVFFDLSGKVQCDSDIKFITDTLTVSKIAGPSTITMTQGGVLGNTGGSSSKLTLSDAAGTTLAYGSNTVTIGSSSIAIDAAAASGNYTVDSTSPSVEVPDGVIVRFNSDATATGILVSTTTNAPFAIGVSGASFLYVGLGKTGITNNTATTFLQATAASNTSAGGTIEFCARADDGTDFQILCGTTAFTCTNKAGTMTANVGAVIAAGTGLTSAIATAGTQTVTFGTSTGAGVCNIRVTSNSAVLVPTTISLTYNLHVLGTQMMAPQ